MSTRPRKTAPLKRGRPKGATSFNAEVALAFGAVVRKLRLDAGLSQESFAHMADIERSHMSRIERGASQPTLYAILRIANALGIEGSTLLRKTERELRKAAGE